MRKIIKNILIFILYLVFDGLIVSLFYLNGIDYQNLPLIKKVVTAFISNVLLIGIIFYFYKDELKEDFYDFKERHNLTKYIGIYLIGVFLMALSNIILQKITNLEIGGNEEAIRKLIKEVPLYIFFSSVIFAPFVEEMIFRKNIRNIFHNKYLFIIISGFAFGILHISDFSIAQILMGIPYIIMGIDFAYIYYKTDNIYTTMIFHLCHNLILFLVQLI